MENGLDFLNPLDIPPTQCNLDFADLPILDLSLCATKDGRVALSQQLHDALSDAGFFYIVNHGISTQAIKDMFGIADVPFSQVDETEKALYRGDIRADGIYRGYKARELWLVTNGVRDQIELYNINRNVFDQGHPEAVRPYLPQISAFANQTHVVLHQILRVLALGLELPEETLVDLHNFSAEGDTSLRFLKYYPRSDEDELKSKNLWMKGHTDAGSLTLLFSQPVSGLQVQSNEGSWKWVKHIENALIVNSGDAMNFLSGGFYRPTIHRVVQPPPDQHNIARHSLFYSCMPDRDVVLAPLSSSPLLQRAGVAEEFQGNNHPTMGEWRAARIGTFGQGRLVKKENGVEEEVLLGKVIKHYV